MKVLAQEGAEQLWSDFGRIELEELEMLLSFPGFPLEIRRAVNECEPDVRGRDESSSRGDVNVNEAGHFT